MQMYNILAKKSNNLVLWNRSAPSEENRTVAVAQETEVVGQSIVVNALPVAANEG